VIEMAQFAYYGVGARDTDGETQGLHQKRFWKPSGVRHILYTGVFEGRFRRGAWIAQCRAIACCAGSNR
jgi:hypothetical protein